MFLRNIAISNYHTFTYHPELILDKGTEFDVEVHNSMVNILVGPNGSGKSNFLSLLRILCDIHQNNSFSTSGIKKHAGFDGYPTSVLAEWVVGGASDEHGVIVLYDLDTMTYEVQQGEITHDFLCTYVGIERSFNHATALCADTSILIRDHLGLVYNSYNHMYLTHNGSLRKRDDLGSGDKSLIALIEYLLHVEIVGGMVLLDEPEIHLHPQYQKQLGQILEIISVRRNCQIIVATHSPFFINDDNIQNVFRFTIRDGHTHTANPMSFHGQEQAKLKQILTDSNMAKLFFVDHIIIVEGDTDEYFFQRYIRAYFKKYRIHPWRYNFELLNISGKSSLQAWRMFCKQFQIQYSFIGDWDNVISSSIFGGAIEKVRQKVPRTIRGAKLTKSEHYRLLIEYISNEYPQLAEQINLWIDQQTAKRSFILRHGDLEAYLQLNDKGLGVVIDWCTKSMYQWLNDDSVSHYRDDIDAILHKIFDVKL